MGKKGIIDKLSTYISEKKMEEKPTERLIRLGNRHGHSALVAGTVPEYLEREED